MHEPPTASHAHKEKTTTVCIDALLHGTSMLHTAQHDRGCLSAEAQGRCTENTDSSSHLGGQAAVHLLQVGQPAALDALVDLGRSEQPRQAPYEALLRAQSARLRSHGKHEATC